MYGGLSTILKRVATENLTEQLILEPEACRVREQAMCVSGRRVRQGEQQLQRSGGRLRLACLRVNKARVAGAE